MTKDSHIHKYNQRFSKALHDLIESEGCKGHTLLTCVVTGPNFEYYCLDCAKRLLLKDSKIKEAMEVL